MPPISLPPSFQKTITADVELKLRKRLGLRAGDPTPPEVSAMIDDAVKKSGVTSFSNRVASDVQASIAHAGEGRTIDHMKENLGFARNGITALAAAAEVDDILKKRAELLFKKKTALQTAGFTSDEAMQILLSDIASKAH